MSNEPLVNTIINGNCYDILQTFPDNFIDLVVTSPPYDDIRDYNGYSVENLKDIINELYRVLQKGGTIVWVVGDSTINGSEETGTSFRQALMFMDKGFKLHDTMIYEKNTSSFPAKRKGNRYTQIFEYMFIFTKGGDSWNK